MPGLTRLDPANPVRSGRKQRQAVCRGCCKVARHFFFGRKSLNKQWGKSGKTVQTDMDQQPGSSDSYLVLARKWRPSRFDQVVGQQHIVQSLQNAITMNRVAGAYLFSGMRGVGKTSMARILALSINCEKGPTVTPCLECANCTEIINGSSMDVIEIDAASNRGIDEMRDIRDHLNYAPAKCRTKIYIIDEVHMLTRESFNAFLKSLEEPPPNTVFIMATTELTKVPETVLSRCQCFEFRAIADAQITAKLASIAKSEKMEISPGALQMIARRAEGSMRDAQSLMDQAIAYAGEKVDEENLAAVLGLVSREKVFSLLEAIIKKETGPALDRLHDLYYAGYDVMVLVRELAGAVRTLLIAKVTADPEKILDETRDSTAAAVKMAGGISAGRLQLFFDILLRTEAQCKTVSNSLSVLEVSVIKMVRLDDVVHVDEILNRLKSLPAAAASTAAAVPPRQGTSQNTDPPQGRIEKKTAETNDSWQRIKSGVIEKNALYGTLLGGIVDFKVEGNTAWLYYQSKFIKESCEKNSELAELIKSEIAKETGKSLNPAFRETTATPAPKKENRHETDAKNLTERLENPLVQKAIEIFNGDPSLENDGR